MYKEKNKTYFLIAIIYWILYMIGLLIMGILYKKGIKHYNIIYLGIAIIGVSIAIIKDKNLINLGFTKEKLKINFVISFIIIITVFIISVVVGKYSILKLIKYSLYYLFYISLIEEILFRGFIQNYLFGLKCNKYLVFLIGALMFSIMHLPFQMYKNNNVSLTYIIEALPQLVFCFTFHLIMCFITCKRKDITIPTALHYAIDYLQSAL
ncbi:MAG: CPBP family intramembrane metalloprotease [Ruminococcus sp.]|nr:CPBP family intramembrane metalloprotease [Ruminococcus sp.]